LCHVGCIKMIIKIKYILLIGLSLIVIGIILPLLMVVHVLNSTFLLNFISYIFSVIGLFIGSIAAMTFVKNKKNQR